MKKAVTPEYQKASTFSGLSFGKIMTIAFCLIATLLFHLPVLAQNVTVRGRVLNDAGQPVPRASVTVKGSAKGVSSDENGNFEISAPANATLVASSVGFGAKEIKLAGKTNVDITLLPSTAANMEQVVVIGYGTQKKKDVTGSVVSVGEKAIREVPAANLQQSLQGRAAGLEIQRTGTTPGAGSQIRIRGERSITGSNDPLLVLDGIPFEGGSINDINPDDVASIDVLKDASATAIYGSRGANGVIIITTKRGRAGETRVSYNGYYGVTSVVRKYPVYDAEGYRAMRETSQFNQGYMPEELASIAEGRETDWQDLMYRNGYMTDHNLTVSGGSGGSTYSLGGGFYQETTVIPGQDFTRYSLRATIDGKVGKRIKVGLNTMNTVGIRGGVQFVYPMFPIVSLSPLMPAYDNAGNIIQSPTGNVDERFTQYSPLYLNNNNGDWVDRQRRLRTFNSLYGEYQIIEGLKYRLNLGLDYWQQENNAFQASNSYFRPQRGNTASVENQEQWGYTAENMVTYDKEFAGKHRVNFTGLYSIQESQYHNTFVSRDSITENFIQYFDLGQASPTAPFTIRGNEVTSAIISYMARANYVYDDKYMLTLTGRRDGSSRLATGHKWRSYPAISVGWNISSEPFMANIKPITNLKLRFGFGQTSNQAIAPYTTLGGVSGTADGLPIRYNFGTSQVVPGYLLTSIPDPNLDWEFTKTYNAGIDFGLLNNRITGSIDAYTANTDRILYNVDLPASSGVQGRFQTNVGEMSNKGLELSLSTVNVLTRGGLNWNTDFNLYFNRNKLLKLNEGVMQVIGNQLFVGHPLTAIYDYTKLGIWQKEEAAEAAKYGSVPGQLKLKDISGPEGKPDGVINANYDRSVIGSGQARLQGGMTNRFTYKGFDLSIVKFARFGGLLISGVHIPTAAYLTVQNGVRNGLRVNYWTPNNPSNDFPMPAAQMSVPADAITTLGYFNASFIKVRSINLGYTLSGDLAKRLKAQSIRAYITAQNPFVLYAPYIKSGGVDPEPTGTGTSGFVGGSGNIAPRALTITLNTPPTRAFLIGANITF